MFLNRFIVLSALAFLSCNIIVVVFLSAPLYLNGQKTFDQKMSHLSKLLISKSIASSDKNITNSTYLLHLSQEERFILENQSLSDPHLPSIYDNMPHLQSSISTKPEFKVSAGRVDVSIVLGISTVKRPLYTYLLSTLENIIQSMTENSKSNCLIVVLIAEFEIKYIHMVANEIENKLDEHLKSGLIEIIAPPPTFYPDMNALHNNLGDSSERVKWRSKQNLDYAFLMMYCQKKGTFYVQLEDDIQAKNGFDYIMLSFALQMSTRKTEWIVLDFCELGFIGKLFKSKQLPSFINYLLTFYRNQPVDWLLANYVRTSVCGLDSGSKYCRKAERNVWIHYKPSLFQHIGIHSSLKGKVQKLRDKQFGKQELHHTHQNPPASVYTNITVYKSFTLERAYKGFTYFWGVMPKAQDQLIFYFNPPVLLDSFIFRSGNLNNYSDKMYNTTVEVLPTKLPPNTKYWRKRDDFLVLGEFDETGVAEGKVGIEFGEIKVFCLHFHTKSRNWVILNQIYLKILKR